MLIVLTLAMVISFLSAMTLTANAATTTYENVAKGVDKELFGWDFFDDSETVNLGGMYCCNGQAIL